MKRITDEIYLKREDEYSFILSKRHFSKDGKVYFTAIGYFSNMDKVINRLKDFGYEQWVNKDLDACRKFMEQATESIRKIVHDERQT